MLGIALELSQHDPLYEDMVLKFAEHFVFIAAAMDRIGENQDELWDEEDGFFYDVLRLPDGSAQRLKVRSMVGLLPLCATTILPLEREHLGEDLLARLRDRIEAMPELLAHHPRRPRSRASTDGACWPCSTRRKLRRILAPHARRGRVPEPLRPARRCRATTRSTRSRSTSHGQTYEVRYLPAESDTGMFGGNSNWRGPVWFPVNYLDPARAAAPVRVLRRRLQGGVPDGLGQPVHAVRGGQELGRRLTCDLRPRRRRPPPGVRRDRAVPDRSATGRT